MTRGKMPVVGARARLKKPATSTAAQRTTAGAAVHPWLTTPQGSGRSLRCAPDAPCLWDGTTLRLGKADPHASDPRFKLVCHHPGVVRSMVFGHDPLRLAEAYFQGDIDIEGDFFAALSLKDHLHSIRLSLRDRLGACRPTSPPC